MADSRNKRPLRLAACAVAASLFAGTVRAQEEAPAEIDANGVAANDDNTVGVFVRDSAVAADKLALAGRMERAQEWDTSAEVYQEVLDGFADRVVATHFDAQGRPDRYGGVTSVIQDRIAAWPEAGREVYVARYGAPAAQMLAGADLNDRAALVRIADRYFVTDAGRDAALRLIELYFAAGEFAASASLADRLLDRHPALSETDRPLLLLRSTIAWRLAGEPSRAKPRAETLAAKFANARAVLGGQERSLAEVAAAELARPTDAAGNAAAHSEANGWRMPFGSNDHAAVATETDVPARGQPPREWGRLLSFEFEQTGPGPGVDGADVELASLRALIKRQRDLGATTGILPSVDGTQIFFQDNARIYARDLSTGAALPGWAATYPADAGTYKVPAAATPRGAQMTVTLTGQHVLAIVGQSDPMGAMFGDDPLAQQRGGGARLVCLDRATGKLIWSKRMSDAATAKAAMDARAKKPKADAEPAKKPDATPEAAPRPDAPPARGARRRGAAPNALPGGNANRSGDESLRQTEPRGSVLVAGDSVYVVARGGEPGSIDDCYLVAFSLASGEFRWARHLASGNASRPNFTGYPQARDAADSHLACVDGRIYVSTDMGAIAAVDATDGGLAWLSLYPRPRPVAQQQRWMNPNAAAVRVRAAFEGNPVIVRDGKVITLPADGEHLFVHDVMTGEEVARVPTHWRQDEDFNLLGGARDPKAAGAPAALGVGVESYNVLVGIAGDRLVLASPQAISTLDWTKIRGGNNGAEFSPLDVVLNRKVMRAPGFEDLAIRGRPFVTDRSVYVPTGWVLCRLDLGTLEALEVYPANDSWQNRPQESPGNVTVVNGNIIVAGPERISVYGGLSLVRQRLEAVIASAPNAVAPRLRYAEAMANAGHNEEAMKWIGEAAAKVGADRPAEDADRAALFTSCATLVRDLNRPGRTPDAPFQRKLLEQLSSIAATPTQQVTARLLRGGLAAQAKDYPAAIEAYQSLIEDPTWGTMRARSGDDTTPIATLAANALKVLLASAEGRAAYGPVETRAAAELDKAKAAGDPLAVFAIAERFPNARAASDAVRISSELLSRGTGGAARPTLNLASLRKLAGGTTDPAARAPLDEAMLRAYLAAGDLPAALGRARRLAWTDADRPLDALPTTTAGLSASTAGALVAQLQQVLFDQQEAMLPDLKANLDGDSFNPSGTKIVSAIASLLTPESASASRPDRVVAISQDRSLKIFEPGVTQPLRTIRVPNVNDRTTISWLANDRLLLRQPSRVACVDVNGSSIAWQLEPASLPAAEDRTDMAGIVIDDEGLVALAPRPAAAPAAAATPEEQQFEQLVQQGNMDPVLAQRLLRNQRLARQNIALRNRNGIVVNGQVINAQVVNVQVNGEWDADPRADEDANESIVDARPVAGGSLIAIATSRGRVVAVDAKSGAVKWRLKLGDRTPATFRTVGDMVVFASTDENASRVIAVDATTGREALRRTFSGSANGRVCNVGVSDEGWLSIVTATGVQLFDLLGGGAEPIANVTISSETGMAPFAQSRAPDHVQFVGGKLLVLSDVVPAGMQGAPSVRSYDLPDLAPSRIVGSKTKQPVDRRFLARFAKDQRLGTEVLKLAAHKDRLYVMTGQFMTSYPVLDEDPAESAWPRVLPDQPSTLSIGSPMLVREGVLLIGWPNDFVGETAPAARAELYSRQTYDGKHESGMCVEDAELSKRGGKIVDRFQPVNGGLYYMTTDGSLVFLPGKPKPADAK